ncbi:MAG: metalloregulator ArsR/SmtB family transcription factor [Candidatus Cloacimonadales bacterium]
MTKEEKERFEELTKISKALAHATRLFIIFKLEEQEYCVNELTEMIDADVSTVSKHLSVLRNAAIISSEKRGNCVYYRLKNRCVLAMFNCLVDAKESGSISS